MDDTIGDAPTAQMAKPTILVPPRGLLFSNGSGPGISPGPATLASSLFPEKGPFSFSMLLAGAMASPLASAQPQMEGPSPFFMVPPGLSPTGLLNSPGYLSSPLQSPFGMSHQQALAHVTAQAALSQSFKQMQAEFHHSSSNHPFEPETSKLVESISEISQPDHKKTVDKPAGDGYNWRKYGQKHVKASGYPRSYYKCTHVDCPVKKKVERNSDGGVSDVTYKGEHNHDLPKHNKRGKDNSDLDMANVSSHSESEISQTTAKPILEHRPEIRDTYDEKDDSLIIVEKGDDDEPIAKRRSLDIRPSVPTSSNQGVSESKIVLQTKSEVDILHDGYKWRKYGQKVVKGNSHPRSYYRCTYAGCNVRKHVERASTDPKAVITTYEGKHNHDIPTGKRNGHSGAYTSAEQLNTQKAVSKDDFGDRDKIPMTLQLKEGQIVA